MICRAYKMPRKVFEIEVELEIQAVTCPGVWLCPNGKITLQLYMLDSCVQTNSKGPVFPIVFDEKYVFRKTFDSAHDLSKLHDLLEEEFLYAELIQWSCCDSGIILATFQTSVAELLYPGASSKGAIAGVDVDLLMEPRQCFPGIIAPKIEVSTRTTIEETVCTHRHRKCDVSVVNPKVITSRYTSRRPQTSRQRRVCHSTGYHLSKMCPRPKLKHPRYYSRPRKHCDYSISCLNLQTPETSRRFSVRKPEICCRDSSSARCRSAPTCLCALGHAQEDCPICKKYRDYFDDICKCKGNETNTQDNIQKDSTSWKGQSPQIPVEYIEVEDETYKDELNPTTAGKIHKRFTDIMNAEDRPNDDLSIVHSDDRLPPSGFCPCPDIDYQPGREKFYKNLEKFYKKLYKRAKSKAKTERIINSYRCAKSCEC